MGVVMKKWLYSEVYIDKIPVSKIYLYEVVFTLFIVIVLIFMHVVNYTSWYNNYGVVSYADGKYIVNIYVDVDDMDVILKNNYVSIDKKKYSYYVYSVSTMSVYLNKNYVSIGICTSLPSKYMINNAVINMGFVLDNKKIISYVKDFIGNK